MKSLNLLILSLVLLSPVNVFAGFSADDTYSNTDFSSEELSAYYDQRNRKTYIQVSNICPANEAATVEIHVQIFQHDRGCDELNFFDTLTPFDTVVYDLDNIIRNTGTPAPINLADDSYGYVLVSESEGSECLIGNFRIEDDAGYEYRTNMVGEDGPIDMDLEIDSGNLIANFNTVDGAMYADVVGYGYKESDADSDIIVNIDNGYSFDIFVYDMNEEPLSCDRRNFACGNVMNYGINEDYMNSRGGPLLCPGGGLANPDGGFISFENGANLDGVITPGDDADSDDIFVNFIGINNNNGTGSMDTWFYVEGFIDGN